MRVAIISDTHDNIWALEAARPHLSQADVLLHCGDLCSPFMFPRLADIMGTKPVHVVWGNNDGDKWYGTILAQRTGTVHLHGSLAELELDGLRVAVNHYPEIAAGLAAAGRYDLVCHGHDHRARIEQVGQTVLLNPGELMGLYGRRTIALFDTATRSAELVEIVLP